MNGNNYTNQMNDLLYSTWLPDDVDDDYSEVLRILNGEFRSFGECILSIMEKKAGHPIDDPLSFVKKACEETKVPLSSISSINTLKSWFSGGPRPKKSDDRREAMFALAFALRLTKEETAELFHKAYLDRAFNQRNYKELVYYYCLDKGFSFSTAQNLITSVDIQNQSSDDKTMYTSYMAQAVVTLPDTAALLQFIQSHGHNFSLSNTSAKKALRKKKEAAAENVKKESETSYEALLQKNLNGKTKSVSSDSYIYSVITDRTITGSKGTTVVSFKNAELPREIKSNFPQVKSLSENTDSFEELRKSIILLFSYVFWRQSKNDPEQYPEADIMESYSDDLNDLLTEANLPPLYAGNPYDWLFLYCTTTDNPLQTFRGILADVLDDPI